MKRGRRQVESDLREASQLQQAILNAANYTIISTSSDGVILTLNAAAERWLGYSAEEVVGKTTPVIFHDPGEIERRVRELSEELGVTIEPGFEVFVAKARLGVPDENEWTYVRKDGSRFPVLLSVTALHDTEGNITGFLGIGSDITARKHAEQALRNSEKRYRDLVENSLGLIGAHDMDGRFLMINPAVARRLGYQPSEIVGKTMAEFLAPSVRTFFGEYLERIRQNETDSGILKMLTRDGEERIWEYRNLRYDEPGKPSYVLGHAHDITERKRAERRLGVQYAAARILAESTTFRDAAPKILQAICESLGWGTGALWRVDRGANVLRYVEGWQAPSVNVEEFRSTSLQTAFRPGVGLPGRVWESGRPHWIADVTTDDNFPRAPVAAKEGLHAALGFPIVLGGEILGVMEFFSQSIQEPDEDLLEMMSSIGSQIGQFAERKQAEKELRESEEQLQAILDNSTAVIYLKDRHGRYILINRRFGTLFHVTDQEVMGKTDYDLFPREMADAFRANDLKVLEAGAPLEWEEVAPHDDGPHTYLSIKFPLRDSEGVPYAICGISTDITERKRMEADVAKARDAALESARLKAEFLANMSHEIRTPMNAIVGMSGLLLDTHLSADQRDFAETVRSSAEALLTLINDILDFSKIEAGKLTFEKMDFDLRNAVEGAVDLVAEAAQAKGVELFSLVYNDVPIQLRGDPGRLRQVLTNLLSNAVKFTGRGEVIVRVTRESETAGSTMLRFAVSDSGIGIHEEAQRTIFEAFSQADGSTTRRYGGTGLGLAISKQLVEMMEGQIGVESAPGKGSTFWFTAKFERQPEEARRGDAPRAHLEGLRVLVVDDNATNRTLVHHQITSWGMRNGSAENGEKALAILRGEAAGGNPYHIAILDMQMPEMDGLMLARAIKSDPDIAATRLLMMTSLGHRDDAAIRDAGVELCLTKPVKQSHLFDCLAVLVGEYVVADSSPPEPQKHAPRHALAKSAPHRREQLRILIAEDNIVNQKVALRQLQRLGYAADAVANGLEVLEALERIPYDVVLMDCQMPEMDGYEAAKEIRRREGLSRHTTILALTANALEGDRERCLAAGMDDYISKPVKQDALSAILERWTDALDQSSERVDSTQTDSANVIDASVIAELRALQSSADPDFFNHLIDLFIQETPHRLGAMRAAVAQANSEALAHEAHALKGSSANLGAMRMHALCEILEEQGRARSTGGAPALLSVLEEEFDRVRKALEAEKNPQRDQSR
ncbi:MAG: PAS domain S-box protein [Acidobacteriota bacterium]